MILVLPLSLFYIKNSVPLVPFSHKEYIKLGISTCYWSYHAFQKVLQVTTKPLLSHNDSGMSVSYFDQREMLGGTFHSLSKNQMERLNELLCCKVQSIVMKCSCWLDFMCHLVLQPVTHLAGSSHDLNSLFISRMVQISSNVILYKMQIIK